MFDFKSLQWYEIIILAVAVIMVSMAFYWYLGVIQPGVTGADWWSS
jgi:hypothetical protein